MQKQIKEVIEIVFPLVKGEINEDSGELTFSVEVDDKAQLEAYDDVLYSLEHFINQSGYSLMMQEDDDYFGARIWKQ
jgi:hypothetical protein